MKEAITAFCKEFAEKHFIPSIIAIAGAIASLLFLPADYWMIVKIGLILFIILVYCIIFLAVKFLVVCYQKLCAHIYANKREKYYNQSTAKDEKETMEKLWTEVDSLSPDDRKLLKEFLDSGNIPITKFSSSRYSGYSVNSLLGSNWVVSTEEYGDEEHTVALSGRPNGKAIPVAGVSVGRSIVTKYKLHDEIFEALKYSKEKFGKISHFE